MFLEVTRPKDKANISLLGISNKLFEIDFGYNLEQIRLQINRPYLAQDDILNTHKSVYQQVCEHQI